MRAAPGLCSETLLMHDGLAFTLDEAIERHRGQAAKARRRYDALGHSEVRALLRFLGSL